MKLFTITNEENHEIVTYDNIYLRKAEYSRKECRAFIEEAKKYYFSYNVESESTDFNDRYSSSSIRYYQINLSNIVIKEDKFYGVIASGLGRFDNAYVICTFDKLSVNIYDGSCYSYVDKTYTLHKYDLPQEALDFVYKYKIVMDNKVYKFKNNEEILDSSQIISYYLCAGDVIMENGLPIGVKCEGHEYLLNNPESLVNKKMEEKDYDCRYHYYYTYSLVEWSALDE